MYVIRKIFALFNQSESVYCACVEIIFDNYTILPLSVQLTFSLQKAISTNSNNLQHTCISIFIFLSFVSVFYSHLLKRIPAVVQSCFKPLYIYFVGNI